MKKFISFLLLLLLTLAHELTCETTVLRSMCPPERYIEGASNIRCYKGLNPFQRQSLTVECETVGADQININSVEWAQEVIYIMKMYGFYGIWIAASKVGDQYEWPKTTADGDIARVAPNPFRWCQGAPKTNKYLVLLCDVEVVLYSMDNCCVSDREDTTDFASMCLRRSSQSQ